MSIYKDYFLKKLSKLKGELVKEHKDAKDNPDTQKTIEEALQLIQSMQTGQVSISEEDAPELLKILRDELKIDISDFVEPV